MSKGVHTLLLFEQIFERKWVSVVVQIDENIAVSVDRNGQPISFLWRGERFAVSDRPVRWYARKEWWLEANRVQRGIGVSVLEVEMWRLVAQSRAKHWVQYDLRHEENRWRLVRIYE